MRRGQRLYAIAKAPYAERALEPERPSSLTATFWRGVVDVKLGIVLGVAMFLGALLGGRIALKLHPVWLRRIFITAVLVLAIKMLFG